MSQVLQPYYYINGSTLYNKGYPITTSAIYSGYSDWVIATQFKNTTGKTIKIDFVELSIGMYDKIANGVLVYADLSTINQSSIKTSAVSQEFTIPIRTNLTPIKYSLDKPIILPAGKMFAFGFKAKTDSPTNYISTAKTFANRNNVSNAKCIYDGQYITSKLRSSDTVPIESTNGVWAYRVPHINIYYSLYEQVPNVSKSSLTLTQGSSETINISNADSWSVTANQNNYVQLSKLNDSQLKITAKYNGVTSTTTRITVTSSTNGKAYIDVVCNPPKLSYVTISKTTIKPTQYSEIRPVFNDGAIGNVTAIDSLSSGNTYQGITLNNNIVNVDKITSDTVTEQYDWRKVTDAQVNFTVITIKHPLNEGIILTTSAYSILVKHWSVSDINIIFSNNQLFNSGASKITYSSSSVVDGGNTVSASESSPLIVDSNTRSISCLSSTSIGNYGIDVHITNDYPIKLTKIINVINNIPFSLKYPITNVTYGGCESYLPLFLTKQGNSYICNPYNFPLFVIIPNDIISGGDITVTVKFNGGTSHNISLKSKIKSPELIGGNIEVLCLNIGTEIVAPPSYNTIYTLAMTFNYTKSDATSFSKSYNLTLIPYSDAEIEPFLYNTYNGIKIQGQNIVYDIYGEIINHLYYATVGNKYSPVKLLMMNYALFGSNCEVVSTLPSTLSPDTYYILANSGTQAIYYNNKINELNLNPISNGDIIGSADSIEKFEYIASCLNNFVSTVNIYSNRILEGTPQSIAHGQKYMWDDATISLLDGTDNLFRFATGDINNDGYITYEDVDMAFAFASQTQLPTVEQLRAGDFSGKGYISLLDVYIIASAVDTDANLKKAATASPWKEVFKLIYNMQMDDSINVKFKSKPTNIEYNVKYNNNYNVKFRG